MSFGIRLKSVLDRKGISYRENRQSFIFDCPKCGKEGHFYVRKRDGGSICFKCGEKYGWRGLVSAIYKCSFRKADEIFFGIDSGGGGESGVDTIDPSLLDGDQEAREPEITKISLGPDFVPIERSSRGVSYLLSRGVSDPRQMIDFDLRYHGAMDAVVFPVKRAGMVYGWQARRIDPKDGELRLVSSKGFSKSRFLLNWDRARHKPSVFVVEGPFDCLKVDVPGIGAVSSFGKQLSLDQVRMIASMECDRIYVGLDPDAADEVSVVSDRFLLRKQVFRAVPPSGKKDFGECDRSDVKRAIDGATLVESKADYLEVYLNG
jgi:hypothetical protein